MNYFQQPIFYALLMCVSGFGIPVMAALNGSLGTKLHSPALATTILFMVGGVVSLAYLFLSGGISKSPIQEPIPIFFYLGGLFVIFYILSITNRGLRAINSNIRNNCSLTPILITPKQPLLIRREFRAVL